MAHLDDLEISRRVIATARPRRPVESIEYRRSKLVAQIEEQIELARLAMADEPLQLERKRGHNVVAVRPRIWWKVDDDGHVATQVRYNNKVPLNLVGRGTTIEVGPMSKLVGTYRTVIRAVKAGELDAAIDRAALRARR